jgi:hypothetical protein
MTGATVAVPSAPRSRSPTWTGRRRDLWSSTLRASDRGRPRGLQVDCQLPASSTSVQLTIHPGVHQYRAVARAIWIEPANTDP